MVDIIYNYLQDTAARTMQIATALEGNPWIATVYFVVDEQNVVYWLSYPNRRHSEEIVANSNIAATVVIKSDKPVIGVQLEGKAEIVQDKNTVQSIMKLYTAKYDQGHQFFDQFVAGANKHELYRLEPQHIQLFDEVNYDEPQQWKANK